jgi:hypothetical protein
MNDDAVAPVVAAMLVLAVLVTFFSIWNAVYLPSLKEQSEMTQLRDVEEAFSRFSSDIQTVTSLKQDMILSKPLPLGGGSVMFNPLSSAGTIRVNEEPKQLYTIGITDNGIEYEVTGRLVNFSYHPVNDFWIDQGYVWHYGYVNVTRGSSPQDADGAALSTPLLYPAMDDVKQSGTIRKFAGSLIETDASPWYNSSTNCSHITVSSVTFQSESGATYMNSNGIGTLALAASVNETGYGVPETRSPNALVVRVSRTVPEPFSLALYSQCDKKFSDLAARYPGNIIHATQITALYNETAILPVPGSLPLDITHRIVAVNVSAY